MIIIYVIRLYTHIMAESRPELATNPSQINVLRNYLFSMIQIIDEYKSNDIRVYFKTVDDFEKYVKTVGGPRYTDKYDLPVKDYDISTLMQNIITAIDGKNTNTFIFNLLIKLLKYTQKRITSLARNLVTPHNKRTIVFTSLFTFIYTYILTNLLLIQRLMKRLKKKMMKL